MKNQVKSEFFSKKLINSLDDKKPKESMFLLASAIVDNCFKKRYPFRTTAMARRFNKHGVLPKSFFRENFLRCTKLMKYLIVNEMTIDDLNEIVVKSEKMKMVILFERNENKEFFKLMKGCENEIN